MVIRYDEKGMLVIDKKIFKESSTNDESFDDFQNVEPPKVKDKPDNNDKQNNLSIKVKQRFPEKDGLLTRLEVYNLLANFELGAPFTVGEVLHRVKTVQNNDNARSTIYNALIHLESKYYLTSKTILIEHESRRPQRIFKIIKQLKQKDIQVGI